ncbi:MAG TPA: hypothetical protein VMV49_15520 [Candidatus Deferrimicrobium sp.]|nr:hypothetical protein [Candidatus Deferrimicrobium sp.]
MNRINKFVTLGYAFSLLAAIICLIFNCATVFVMHSSLDWIPVIIFVTYRAQDLILFYFVICISSCALILLLIKKLKPVLKALFFVTPFAAGLLLLFMLLVPNVIIVVPVSTSQAFLDTINVGGWIFILIAVILVITSLSAIFSDKKLISYLILVILFVCGALTAEFIHESGHAIFVILSGGTVTEFVPIPWMVGGHWIAGYVSFTGVPENLVPLVMIGSEIFQWISLAILCPVLFFHPKIKIRKYLICWFLFAWVDFPLYTINNALAIPHWFFFGGLNGDVLQFCNLTGFPLWVMIIFAILQLVLGSIFLYKILRKKDAIVNTNQVI